MEEKPPEQKPNGTPRLRLRTDRVKAKFEVLTGNDSPQSVVGIQNRWFTVYMVEPQPFNDRFGDLKKKTKRRNG